MKSTTALIAAIIDFMWCDDSYKRPPNTYDGGIKIPKQTKFMFMQEIFKFKETPYSFRSE